MPSPAVAADEVVAGARALRTVIAGDAALPPVPAAMIDAVTRDVYGVQLDAASLAPIAAGDVAAAITDPSLRHRLVSAGVAVGMTVHPSDPSIADRVRELAAALGVDEPVLAAFERAAQGHRYWMLADFARHSWAGDEVKQEVRDRGIRAFAGQMVRLHGHGHDDPEVVARFAGLADLPADSWGRAVSDFYARHHWPLPGQVGSVPLLTTHHDWVHVASGYDASPIGELQVSAFMAAQMPDETSLSMLFFAWSIYETGMIKVPLSPGAVGTIATDPENPHQVADAIRRGAESGVDLLDLDHWAHAHRPLAEIREEFGIGPKRLPGPDAVPDLPVAVSA